MVKKFFTAFSPNQWFVSHEPLLFLGMSYEWFVRHEPRTKEGAYIYELAGHLMRYIKLLCQTAFSIILFYGCKPCGYGSSRTACVDKISFIVVDKASRQPLRFGSYELFMDLKDTAIGGLWSAVYPESADPGNARYYANPSLPDDTVYLRLNRTDIDTLVLYAVYEETKCCIKYSHISAIHYNGQISPMDGNTFLFQK